MKTKSTRLSAEAARQLMIDAGTRSLESEGLSVAVDNISIDRAIRDTGVPRSSAYNAWTNIDSERTPQDTYRRAVIRHIITNGLAGRRVDAMAEAAKPVLAASSTMTQQQFKRALIRVASTSHYRFSLEHRNLHTALAMLASVTSAPADDQDSELLEWLSEAEARWRLTLIDHVFKPLADVLSMRPRPELAGPLFWTRFATGVVAMGAGLLPRFAITDDGILDDFTLRSPGGEREDWSLFALMMEGLFDRFFEPIPNGP